MSNMIGIHEGQKELYSYEVNLGRRVRLTLLLPARGRCIQASLPIG